MMLVMPRMNPANDNQEKLPNNGWWTVPVFILAVLAVLVISAFRAYGGESVEVKYRGWPVDHMEASRCYALIAPAFMLRMTL